MLFRVSVWNHKKEQKAFQSLKLSRSNTFQIWHISILTHFQFWHATLLQKIHLRHFFDDISQFWHLSNLRLFLFLHFPILTLPIPDTVNFWQFSHYCVNSWTFSHSNTYCNLPPPFLGGWCHPVGQAPGLVGLPVLLLMLLAAINHQVAASAMFLSLLATEAFLFLFPRFFFYHLAFGILFKLFWIFF